jgi:hypothetical protein
VGQEGQTGIQGPIGQPGNSKDFNVEKKVLKVLLIIETN